MKKAEWGTKEESGMFHNLKRQSWESGETKVARVEMIEYQRRESSGDLQIVPLKYSNEYWSVHACEDTICGWEELSKKDQWK